MMWNDQHAQNYNKTAKNFIFVLKN